MKKAAPTLIAIIVGLVAGYALGSIRTEERRDVRPAVESEGDIVRDTSHSSSSVSEGDAKPEDRATKTQTPSMPDAGEEPEAQPADENPFSAMLPPVPTGDGVAEGNVTSHDGSPLAGLQFRAIPSLRRPFSQRRYKQFSIEDRLAYDAAATSWGFNASIECTSEAEGRFRFEGMADDHYDVTCLTPWFSIRTRGGSTWVRAKPGDELDLLASRMCEVNVNVRLPDGNAPDICHVICRSLDKSAATETLAWTPATHTMEVPTGACEFTVRFSSSLALQGEVVVDIPESGPTPDVVIELEKPPGLYLTVELPDPFYDDTSVVLYPAKDVDSGAGYPGYTRTRKVGVELANDVWYFEELPPGRYVAFLMINNTNGYTRQTLEVTDDNSELSFHVPPLDLSKHLTVRTLDTEGKPLAGVRVSCNLADSEIQLGDSTASIETEPGVHLLRLPEDQRGRHVPLDGVDVLVIAHHATGTRYGRTPADNPTDVEIRFGESCAVQVKVENLPQRGRNDMWVAVVPEKADMYRSITMARHAESRRGRPAQATLKPSQTVNDLPPGRAVVCVVVEPAHRYEVVLAKQEVELVAGLNEVTLKLPNLYTLELQVPESVDARGIYIVGGDFDAYIRAGDNGLVTQHGLPAGDYRVGDSGNGWMNVNLPVQGPVTFEPLPHNCLSLRRYDYGGRLYKAGLRLHDQIVSIDGSYPEDLESLKALWDAAKQAASVRLEVDRDGRTLYIDVPGSDLDEADDDRAIFRYERR